MTDEKKIVEGLHNLDHSVIENLLIQTDLGIMITNAENIIIWSNQTMLDIMGYNFDELIGENANIFASDANNPNFHETVVNQVHAEGSWSGEIIDKRKNGSNIHCHKTITVTFDETFPTNSKKVPMFYTSVVRDNTAQRTYENQLRTMAFKDPLTGLYNRRYLMEHLTHVEALSKRTKSSYAVILIDLDDFSIVNNTMGHEVGDKMLVQFTKRLSKAFPRETDIVARLGGDEFVVLMTNLNEKYNPITAIKNHCERLVHSFVQPYHLNNKNVSVTASIGVVFCANTKDHCTEDNILTRADNAMYVAKRQGKNAYYIDSSDYTQQK